LRKAEREWKQKKGGDNAKNRTRFIVETNQNGLITRYEKKERRNSTQRIERGISSRRKKDSEPSSKRHSFKIRLLQKKSP